MAELIDLRGAELGNVREEPKSQIPGADIGQKIPVQRHVFWPQPADQHALAARNRFVQFARAKVALVRHRRDAFSLRWRYEVLWRLKVASKRALVLFYCRGIVANKLATESRRNIAHRTPNLRIEFGKSCKIRHQTQCSRRILGL